MGYQAPRQPARKDDTNGLPTHCPPVNAVQRIAGHALMLLCLVFSLLSVESGLYGWAVLWTCLAILELVLTWTCND